VHAAFAEAAAKAERITAAVVLPEGVKLQRAGDRCAASARLQG
jgi:hypothetical protein